MLYYITPYYIGMTLHHFGKNCSPKIPQKGIPPNAIWIALSSVGSWVPATEPQWQIKWACRQGLNPRLQHSRLTC